MLLQKRKESPKQNLDEACYNTGKEDNAMDGNILFSDNSVLFVSRDKIKRKRTVSPEWKKVQEFCAHHDVEIVTDPKTGKPIVKVIDLE